MSSLPTDPSGGTPSSSFPPSVPTSTSPFPSPHSTAISSALSSLPSLTATQKSSLRAALSITFALPFSRLSPSDQRSRIQSTWLANRSDKQSAVDYPSKAEWKAMRMRLVGTWREGAEEEDDKAFVRARLDLGKLEKNDSPAISVFRPTYQASKEEEYMPESLGDLMLDGMLTGDVEGETLALSCLKEAKERTFTYGRGLDKEMEAYLLVDDRR
ncbi:hypothetical protein IAT38_007957 [Cryptococcus sp. DSM 104549]